MAQQLEKFSISAKAKYKDTGFCPKHGLVERGADGQCIVMEQSKPCNFKLRTRKPRTDEHVRKQFERYIRQYRECLDVYMPSDPEDKNNKQFYAVIKIGIYNYFVPMKRVQEFENINYANEDDAFERFINRIRTSCAYQIAL